MARPNTLQGKYINLRLGDGATPEVFNIVCGLIDKSFTNQVNTNDQFIPDCADPESIPWREVVETGRQKDISGSGFLNRANLADMHAALGQKRNWRYEFDEPTGDTVYGGYWGGVGVMTNFEVTGTQDDLVSVTLTVVSHGAWTFTAA